MPPKTKARRRSYKRRRLYKKGAKKTKRFTRAVQRIINKNAENKQALITYGPISYNSAINSSGDCTAIVPNISVGTGDNARIGDQLRCTSIQVKGAVVWNPNTAAFNSYQSCRLCCRLMIVQPKAYNTLQDVINNAGTWTNYLLKTGGTTTGFQGNMADLWKAVNTDAITCYYDRKFYLTGTFGPSTTATSDIQLLGATKFFSKTMKFRGAGKLLKYDSSVNSGIQPTMFAPVMILGYVYMNGASPTVLNTDVQLSFDSIFNYHDI